MASKWRIFRKPIIAREDMVNAIVKATVVLHNFIKISENNSGNIVLYKMQNYLLYIMVFTYIIYMYILLNCIL